MNEKDDGLPGLTAAEIDMAMTIIEREHKQSINNYNNSFSGRINAIFHGKKKINPFFEKYFKSRQDENWTFDSMFSGLSINQMEMLRIGKDK
jgi:hypothetical protein